MTDVQAALTPADELDRVLAAGVLRSVFQPIVDLESGAVVAFEALVRGPEGPLARPDELFAAAREHGRLAELDAACRLSAFRSAVRHELFDPVLLFVNVEPQVLDTAPLDDLLEVMAGAAGDLRVVLEITERALATRPADLLATVERVRSLGWGVALDDVGAEPLSLAFMPLLRPDVVKLDLALTQERPGAEAAQIMNAVGAYAERSGAVVLAEGIETEQHVVMARALGATLGQGWHFGRPAEVPDLSRPVMALAAPSPPSEIAPSPFTALPPGTVLRRSPKPLLIEVSKQLEREALRIGETAVVTATFQHARYFTPSTTARYRDLAERVGFVCALGEDMPEEPVPGVPGVRGVHVPLEDPILGEWDVAVVGPHFAGALLARDLGDIGIERERMFEYALTYDRDVVIAAARSLMSRVVDPLAPVLASEELLAASRPAERVLANDGSSTTTTSRGPAPLPARLAAPVDPALMAVLAPQVAALQEGGPLARALEASTSGITVCDATAPDSPLVYVNGAFEALAGFDREDLVGRSCRFLQGRDSDPAAVARLRAAVATGGHARETLLNYRGPARTPWWNEVVISPVHDAEGALVQYVGVQTDVSARVEAQRALRLERDRAASLRGRLDTLARTDALTQLLNRRAFTEAFEIALWDARASGDSLVVALCDVDGLSDINAEHGTAVGDAVLAEVAARLRRRVRRSDLLARTGDDQFVAVLTGLHRSNAAPLAETFTGAVHEAMTRPVETALGPVEARLSIGVSGHPGDGDGAAHLVRTAEAAMRRGRERRSPTRV